MAFTVGMMLTLTKHVIAAPALSVHFADTAANVSVIVDGIEWFSTDALMVTEGGKSFSNMNGTLTAKHTQRVSGTDVWGVFNGRETTFIAEGNCNVQLR